MLSRDRESKEEHRVLAPVSLVLASRELACRYKVELTL